MIKTLRSPAAEDGLFHSGFSLESSWLCPMDQVMEARRPECTVPLSLLPGSEKLKVRAHRSVNIIFLKICLVIKNHLESVIFKQICYKTGSQWPGEISHKGTRSENVLSAQSNIRPTKQQVGQHQRPRPGWPLQNRGISPSQSSYMKFHMKFLISKRGASGRRMGGKLGSLIFCSSPSSSSCSWWAQALWAPDVYIQLHTAAIELEGLKLPSSCEAISKYG